MAVTKTTYINTELIWAEEQLQTWRQYVTNNPIHDLKDRIEWRQTKTGAMPMVVASIEAQGKFIQETMKNYLALLEVVDKLRLSEQSKTEIFGKGKLGTQANKFLEGRDKK